MSKPSSRPRVPSAGARRAFPPRDPAPPTDWDAVAPWYDDLVQDEGSEYQREVIFPGALKLLQPKPGQRALDLACGQGAWCRLLHAQGLEVTGVDASPALLHRARQRSDPGIHFLNGDIRQLDELGEPSHPFDLATCILAIQNVQPIAPVFQSLQPLMIEGGQLLIVMMHPAFRGPRYASWGWDAEAGVQFRRVDRYLLSRKHPIQTHPGARPQQYTWTFHRPLGDYVRALALNGFLIDAIEEWPGHKVSTSGPRAPAENVARKEIPLFMAIRAVRASIPRAPNAPLK